MAKFATELVDAVKSERVRFGGRRETDPTVRDVLIEYWTTGAGRSESTAKREIRDRTAWSAAFISFVVKKALRSSGSKATFKFSASHSEYVGAAIRNVLQSQPAPAFIGLPPTGVGAVKPEVGDIVGVTRERAIDDYADALDAARAKDPFFSHFDVVTGISGGKLKCIGGNVIDSVNEKTVRLAKDGILPILPFRFNAAGQVISGPYICVIKHKSE